MRARALAAARRGIIRKIVTSDPIAPAYYNRVLHRDWVEYLPDVFSLNVNDAPPSADAAPPVSSVAPRKFTFLGEISECKGILPFVQAASELLSDPDAREKAHFLIAGKIIDAHSRIEEALCELARSYPDNITIESRRLSDNEMIDAIEEADFLCVPYINYSGSSSFLNYGAFHGKPLLGPRFGLMGELIRRYDLGATCRTESPQSILTALRDLISFGEPERVAFLAGRDRFIKENFNSRFGDSLLSIASRELVKC